LVAENSAYTRTSPAGDRRGWWAQPEPEAHGKPVRDCSPSDCTVHPDAFAFTYTRPGTSPTVTGGDGADGGLVPAALVATTLNEYRTHGVNPEIVQLVDELVVHVCPPGVAVAVYDEIGKPPSLAGGAQLTVAWVPLGEAFTFSGADGTVLANIGADGMEGGPLPTELDAATVNV
jgi:hypothetical protein